MDALSRPRRRLSISVDPHRALRGNQAFAEPPVSDNPLLERVGTQGLMMLLFLAAQAALAGLSVERIDEHSFRMELAAPQAGLQPAARLACQKRKPVFARYRIVSEVPPEGAKPASPAGRSLEQQLLCLETGRRAVPAATRPDPQWQPTATDERALLAATYEYFTAKDAGRYAEAHGRLSDRMKAATPLAEWATGARLFNAEAGPALGRRVIEISWYNHPTDAPEPGIYVAADYSAEFERLEFVCGYVMWRLLPDGSFRLVREEQNLARKRGPKPMASIDRDPMRVRLGCKD
jgi:hypothetical protein